MLPELGDLGLGFTWQLVTINPPMRHTDGSLLVLEIDTSIPYFAVMDLASE